MDRASPQAEPSGWVSCFCEFRSPRTPSAPGFRAASGWSLGPGGGSAGSAPEEEVESGELKLPAGASGLLPIHCRSSGLTRAALLPSTEGEGDGPDGDATAEHF